MLALALATLDAFILLTIRQAQTVDTSVWIAVIAGVVGLLTLLIQTYGQVQLAKIKDKQTDQAAAVVMQTKKIDDQAVKLQEVHTVVNSGQTRLIEQVEKLTAKVGQLEGVAAERGRSDAKEQNRQQGAADERNKLARPAADK